MQYPEPINFYRMVSLNFESLKRLGLWFYIPHPKTSLQYRLHIIWRVLMGIVVFFIPALAQIAYIVKQVGSDDFQIQEAASSINLVLTELLISLKLLDLFVRRDQLTRLTDLLIKGEFYRAGIHRKILERSIGLSRKLFFFFLVGASLDVLFHMVVAPGLNRFLSLPVKMYLFFIDANDPAYFTYVYAYQILYKPVLVINCIALQTLTWAFLLFAIAQLDILIYNFKNMKEFIKEIKLESNCSEDEAFKEIFTRCVLHHRAIISLELWMIIVLLKEDTQGKTKAKKSFIENAEEAFRGQFTLDLIMIGFIVCTTGVQFFAIESPSKDIVAVLWVLAYMQIFILLLFCDCYFGNIVFVKSTEVATVAFECPWLTVSPQLKKNLIVFIARAQRPLVITAYTLVPISLPTFTKVMNWTYKVFTVMNQMKK